MRAARTPARLALLLGVLVVLELGLGLALSRGEGALRRQARPGEPRSARAAAIHRLLGRGVLDADERAALRSELAADPDLAAFVERSFPRFAREGR